MNNIQSAVGFCVVARTARDGVVSVTDILSREEAWDEVQTWAEVGPASDRYSVERVDADGSHHEVYSCRGSL